MRNANAFYCYSFLYKKFIEAAAEESFRYRCASFCPGSFRVFGLGFEEAVVEGIGL